MPTLSPKQENFCKQYLIDLNGAQSAIRAGYSKKTAKEQATRLLTNVHIKKKIDELIAKRDAKTEVTADRILAELGKIAFSDIRKFYGKDSTLLNVQSLDDDTAGAISGIEIEEIFDKDGKCIGTTKKIKTNDKTKALELFMRHKGMFEKDNSQVGKNIKITIQPKK